MSTTDLAADLAADPAGEPDLIDRLTGFGPGHPLTALRAQRGEVRFRTQAAHDALLSPSHPGALPAAERAATAARLAILNGDAALVAHYAALAGEATARPAVLAHVERVTRSPRDSAPEHLAALAAAGLDEHAIVALSQLIALVNYQARLLAGLRALAGQRTGSGLAEETVSSDWRPVARERPFTTAILDWLPWIAPVDLDRTSAAQREALAVTPSNTQVGAYSLVLAHEPEALLHRTPLFNGIMYAPRGLPRAERELATAVESVLNGCVYCASVHARRFVELTVEGDLIGRFFTEGPAVFTDPRWRAIVDAATRLSRTPAVFAAADVERLRGVGLADLEILDLILAVAIFAWANRLMLSLGEPAD